MPLPRGPAERYFRLLAPIFPSQGKVFAVAFVGAAGYVAFRVGQAIEKGQPILKHVMTNPLKELREIALTRQLNAHLMLADTHGAWMAGAP